MMAYRREFRYKVQRWLVKKTNIITTSDYTRNVVAAKEICEKRKIKVIPICISDKWPMSTKKRENLVMFVGDAIHKNTTAAINVFKTLSERVRDWKYVMVGSKERIYSLGGLYAKELQASNILQIEENVPDEIFEAIFLKSKILFMPSLSEGFGVPVLQAFATGTCVLISDRGALPEVGGDAAVYVDPDNPAEMVSTLEGLMKNDSLQEALIEKGKKRVKKYFWQEHMKKLVKLYRQVAKHG
jgi:glycosyltransferase involved in cell wall biosynthesis